MTRFVVMNDIHPLAGREREPGWTIKDETDALKAAEDKIIKITTAVIKEKGLDKGMKWMLEVIK